MGLRWENQESLRPRKQEATTDEVQVDAAPTPEPVVEVNIIQTDPAEVKKMVFPLPHHRDPKNPYNNPEFRRRQEKLKWQRERNNQ